MSNFKEDLNKVKAFVFDIDGVLTDGRVYCMGDGEQVRSMNVKDGFGIRCAINNGYPVGIISAGHHNGGALKRLEFLGIPSIYNGHIDKRGSLDAFCEKHNVSKDEILYMGDDIPDIPVLKLVGIPTCPSDARPEVKSIAKYISHLDGGQACARDVIEQVLRAQGKWFNPDADEAVVW